MLKRILLLILLTHRSVARTIPELCSVISSAYTPSICIKRLAGLYNIKEWLDEFNKTTLSGHSRQHQFKIKLQTCGQAAMWYKKWSTCESWMPENSQGLQILTPGDVSGIPPIVVPQLDQHHLMALKKDLPSKFKLSFDQECNKVHQINWFSFKQPCKQLDVTEVTYVVRLCR